MKLASLAFPCALLGALFVSSPETDAQQVELFKLIAGDNDGGDLFGYSVALSGNHAVIGAHGDDQLATNAGAAYVFDIDTQIQDHKLVAHDGAPSDAFGFSVAVDGILAVVGAPQENSNGAQSGAAYVFDVLTGQPLMHDAAAVKLIANDGAPGDELGRSVGISGDFVVAGAPGDDDNGSASGAAYVFDLLALDDPPVKLTPSDGAAVDSFGWSVAISGNLAVVGAYRDDDLGSNAGAAYVFDVGGTELFKLTASNGMGGHALGWSAAIDGNLTVLGQFSAGSGYVFDAMTGGPELQQLTSSQGGISSGYSVGISGMRAILGAYQDDPSGPFSGSARFFSVTTGAELPNVLIASDGATFDRLGHGVAISGNRALVGAFGDDSDAGAAYVYDVPMGGPPGGGFIRRNRRGPLDGGSGGVFPTPAATLSILAGMGEALAAVRGD